MQHNFAYALNNEIFSVIRTLLQISGHEGYVIGGFVRDLLLNKDCKDIDIVVVGSGVTFAQAFADAVGKTDVRIYENFGTALVRYGEYNIEFVGARKESYRKTSRKPIVEDGTLLDDQLRRDLTINALSISLNHDNFGTLIDPFGGLKDLEQKIIRTPRDPNITFSDDPLRIMRAVRFATVLEFKIEPKVYRAIIANAHRLEIVSMERITEELNKMLLAKVPSVGFKMLFNTGVLQLIFPELCLLHGVETVNGISHKDNFYHTLKVLDNVAQLSDNLWLRWGALLHDIAKPQTKRFDPRLGWTFHGHDDKGARMTPHIFKRLKLPNNEKMRFVQKMVQLHLRPIALVDEEVTDSAIRRLIVDAGDDLQDLLKLCRADITTRDSHKLQRYLSNYDAIEARIIEVEARDQLRNWQPPITGEIIMAHFNLKPCQTVGIIKNAVRDAILDGVIPNDFDHAFAFMVETGEMLKAKHPETWPNI